MIGKNKTTQTNPDNARSPGDGLAGLEAIIARSNGKKKALPPVDKWEPDYCGELDIVIHRDGSWSYMGTPIGRKRLVQLFSTVLRKDEDGETYLVTPVEKIKIAVEDAHFRIVEMHHHIKDGEPVISLRTNMDELIEVGDRHPLQFEIEENSGGVKPYCVVRGRLVGLFTPQTTIELMGYGEEMEYEGEAKFVIRSAGVTFPIVSMNELSSQMDQT